LQHVIDDVNMTHDQSSGEFRRTYLRQKSAKI